jgi:hypothetical protein
MRQNLRVEFKIGAGSGVAAHRFRRDGGIRNQLAEKIVEKITPDANERHNIGHRNDPPHKRHLLKWSLFSAAAFVIVLAVLLGLIQKLLWMRELDYVGFSGHCCRSSGKCLSWPWYSHFFICESTLDWRRSASTFYPRKSLL